MEYLSAKDVTAILPISREQVYDLAREKIIPSIKVGGRVFFRRSDIQYISEHGTRQEEEHELLSSGS